MKPITATVVLSSVMMLSLVAGAYAGLNLPLLLSFLTANMAPVIASLLSFAKSEKTNVAMKVVDSKVTSVATKVRDIQENTAEIKYTFKNGGSTDG
jgi:mannose/fructose-specific phosphotransferase system component IIA